MIRKKSLTLLTTPHTLPRQLKDTDTTQKEPKRNSKQYRYRVMKLNHRLAIERLISTFSLTRLIREVVI